jgi:hypothetical protein
MIGQAGLLLAKLSPPQPYRRTLVRPRVLACLSRAHAVAFICEFVDVRERDVQQRDVQQHDVQESQDE